MNATSVAGPDSESRLRARRGTWHGSARARGRVGARSGPPQRSHSLCDTAGAPGLAQELDDTSPAVPRDPCRQLC